MIDDFISLKFSLLFNDKASILIIEGSLLFFRWIAWGRHGFDGCRGVWDSRPRISGPSLIIQELNLIADNYNYAMAA